MKSEALDMGNRGDRNLTFHSSENINSEASRSLAPLFDL